MRKLIALTIVFNVLGVTCLEAMQRRSDSRGTTATSADHAARQPFDRVNGTAPVRKSPPGEDIFTGE